MGLKLLECRDYGLFISRALDTEIKSGPWFCFPSCVTLDKSLKISEPRFPLVQNGDIRTSLQKL